MPILDVMPVSTWRDLRTVMVRAKTPSDEDIAEKLMPSRRAKSVQSFMHLRGAVEFLFKNVEFPHKRVVFPKFICESVVRAAERAGMQVTLCDIDMETGAISVTALAQIPLEKFGAVFVVHPFGIPAEMEKISSLCKQNDVFLIEDCAHVFDQIVDGKSVGSFGDFVLYHFAKKLPNVHGGLLISYKFKLPDAEIEKGHTSLGELFTLFLRTKLLRQPLNLIRSLMNLPGDQDAAHDKHFAKPLAASDGSKRLFMKKFKQFRGEKHLRGEVYKAYLEYLPGNFKALARSVPGDLFHFPVLVPMDKKRDEIMKKLRVFNIYADRVWYSVDHDFARRLLLLPVTARMREKDVKLICNLLKNV